MFCERIFSACHVLLCVVWPIKKLGLGVFRDIDWCEYCWLHCHMVAWWMMFFEVVCQVLCAWSLVVSGLFLTFVELQTSESACPLPLGLLE